MKITAKQSKVIYRPTRVFVACQTSNKFCLKPLRFCVTVSHYPFLVMLIMLITSFFPFLSFLVWFGFGLVGLHYFLLVLRYSLKLKKKIYTKLVSEKMKIEVQQPYICMSPSSSEIQNPSGLFHPHFFASTAKIRMLPQFCL